MTARVRSQSAPTAGQQMIGQTLGTYEILSPLGKGGMGEVVACTSDVVGSRSPGGRSALTIPRTICFHLFLK